MKDKRYNRKLKRFIEIKEGENFCPKCNGLGEIRPTNRIIFLTCNICLGAGKLDWVERIVGKEVKRVMLYDR